MNEHGVTRYCANCNHSFFSIDGDVFCSSKCIDEWELHLCYADELDEFGDNDF
jgi:hypothetical protein